MCPSTDELNMTEVMNSEKPIAQYGVTHITTFGYS